MFQGHKAGAILLMAGTGTRFGGPAPKQFSLLRNKPLYLYALESLQASGWFDEIVLVCPPLWIDQVSHKRKVGGGPTRQSSTRFGLSGFSISPDLVLIHDGVRPFLSQRIIRENLEIALAKGAADTCIPSADTLVHAPNGNSIATIPLRKEYLRGQTPQTFRYSWIVEAHENARGNLATDDCQLVLHQGRPVHIVRGEEWNLKVTTPFDLALAECLLERLPWLLQEESAPHPTSIPLLF